MYETQALIDTLKQELRKAHKTYAHVAEALHLSEASVKQMFSSKRLTLERLDAICVDVLGLDISELVAIMHEREPKLTALTEHQEQQLVADTRLLLVAVSIMNNWSPTEISAIFTIDQAQCEKYLVVLESLRLIKIKPSGEIKMLVARNFDWLPRGPIQSYFQEHIREDFLGTEFDQANEKLIFLTGAFSQLSTEQLLARMEKLAEEFKDLNEQDTKLPLNQRFGGSLVIAYRPWIMETFAALRR